MLDSESMVSMLSGPYISSGARRPRVTCAHPSSTAAPRLSAASTTRCKHLSRAPSRSSSGRLPAAAHLALLYHLLGALAALITRDQRIHPREREVGTRGPWQLLAKETAVRAARSSPGQLWSFVLSANLLSYPPQPVPGPRALLIMITTANKSHRAGRGRGSSACPGPSPGASAWSCTPAVARRKVA